MLSEFVEKILEINRPEVVQDVVAGDYTTQPLHLVAKPAVGCLEISSLAGVADYINGGCIYEAVDSEDIGKHPIFIQVSSHREVNVVIGYDRECQRRQTVLSAIYPDQLKTNYLTSIDVHRYMDSEWFIVLLLGMFEKEPMRDTLLSLVSNVVTDKTRTSKDDGISQVVTVKKGIQSLSECQVENPVYLKPFVTFDEISNPGIPFIFRMRKNGDAMEFVLMRGVETMWQHDTKIKIADWLARNITADDLNYRIIY